MPTVHDGIGTWYYGKTRRFIRKGSCRHCKRHSNLESYDTTLFFVIFFVPILPLSRKRILEQCSSCQRHQVLALKKWEAAKNADIAAMMEKFEKSPDDREAILHALRLSIGYQDEPLFLKVAESLAVDRQNDPEIQSQLGDGYAYFARWPEAETAYRAALAKDNKEDTREQLAWALLQQERPEDALPYLGHILENKKQDSVGMIYHLIGAYQAQGAHAEALALMDERDAAFPDLAGLKEYRSQRKISEKHKDSGKKVRWASLGTPDKTGYREGGKFSRLPRLIPLALLAVALLAYFGSAWWIGHNRKVFLLNGSDKPYTIALNDVEYTLNPGGPTAVRIPEGKIRIEFRSLPLPLEPVDCEIETNFWSRPFVNKTFVVNPDQLALVYRQETVYSEKLQGVNPPPPPEAYMGRCLFSFQSVDYEFEIFPQTIQINQGQTVTKARVGYERFTNSIARLDALSTFADKAGQIAYVKRYVTLEPGNAYYLKWLASTLDAEETIAFLKTRIQERPILLEWHRAYQSAMEIGHPEVSLPEQYQKIAGEQNNNPDALYLLGRVHKDPHERTRLFLQAAQANPPCPRAFYGLGWDALTAGKFSDAIKWYEKMEPGKSTDPNDRIIFEEALFANKDYGRIMQEVERQIAGGQHEFNELMYLFRAAILNGDKAKTESAKQQILGMFGSADLPFKQQSQAILETEECSCRNDIQGYVKLTSKRADTVSVCSYLLEDKLTEAETQLEKADKNNVGLNGLLYLYGSRAKKPQIAEAHWNAMVATLSQGDREERLAAEMAKGSKPLNAAQVLGLSIHPQEKRVVLAAFAEHFPDHAKEFLELARTLNYQHDAVSLCLEEAWKSRQ